MGPGAVATSANLLGAYETFAELVQACEGFLERVTTRPPSRGLGASSIVHGPKQGFRRRCHVRGMPHHLPGRTIDAGRCHRRATPASVREVVMGDPVILTEGLQHLPGVRDVATDGEVLRCVVEGPADALVKAAAQFPVVSLLSHEPDLEELFLADYTEGREPRAA
jgi:hypothetical protein